MPIMLNTILQEVNLNLKDIRLIRHKDSRAKQGFSPYELWRNNKEQFESYQSTQSIYNRPTLNAPYWAVFVVNRSGSTIFAGLYTVKYLGLNKTDIQMPHMDGIDKSGTCDVYDLILQERLNDFIGKLHIEWGKGKLAWVQYAHRNNKIISELQKNFKEPDFPGFLNFMEPISRLTALPNTWQAALKASKGIYLLTCPRTKEQYVGSATGHDGFFGRWIDYAKNGHGGNLGLKSREPSDYQVSILEVASSSANHDDILKMEGLWQRKLQSKAMGLNRNIAG